MNRILFRTIEKHLHHKRAIELAVREAREEQINSSSPRIGGEGHVFKNDPTAQAAIKLAMPLNSVDVPDMGIVNDPESWLECMNRAYEAQDDLKRELLRRRYNMHETTIRLSIDYNFSRKSVYNICREFVMDIALRLVEKGIVKYD